MKSICIITTIPLTLKTFFMEIAEYLHNIGEYKITFICDMDYEFKAGLPEYIEYVPIGMNRGIDFKGLKSIIKLYKHFRKNKYSIIQYATPNAAFYASIAGKMAKAPIRLYSQLGLLYPEYKGVIKFVLKVIEKITCANSTHIEPVSNSNLNKAIMDGLFNRNKGRIVWNGSTSGVKLSKFNIARKREWNNLMRTSTGIAEDAFIVGYVGRITKAKGINEFLEAGRELLKKYKDIYLIFIGEFEYKKKLDKNLLEWAHTQERVYFAGTTLEVEKYYSMLDVLVLPSYREGFGSVVIEAESMGVPVIVSDITGPSDAMINEVTGLKITPRDYEAIIKAVEKLYSDKSICSLYGENGRKFVENSFDQETLIKHILIRRNEMINGK